MVNTFLDGRQGKNPAESNLAYFDTSLTVLRARGAETHLYEISRKMRVFAILRLLVLYMLVWHRRDGE